MQGLFLEYKDPLFGLIIFVSIIFLVAFVTYLWNIYSTRYNNRHLIDFANSFNTTEKEQSLEALLNAKTLPPNALELLAQTYYKTGHYEETIEIALELLKYKINPLTRKDHLYLLAKAYYKGGFYKRAERTLVELLRYHTDEAPALNYLIVIYERLQRFEDALDALLPLKEMGHDTTMTQYYLQVMQTIRNTTFTQEEKASHLLELFNQNHRMLRPVFMYLFRQMPQTAWQYLPLERAEEVMDILWNLEKKEVNFDIIASHSFLQALYFAKGYNNQSAEVELFDLNLLNHLTDSTIPATLAFDYICSACKELTPLMNHRCPHCMQLLTLQPKSRITKRRTYQTNNTF